MQNCLSSDYVFFPIEKISLSCRYKVHINTIEIHYLCVLSLIQNKPVSLGKKPIVLIVNQVLYCFRLSQTLFAKKDKLKTSKW